MPEKLLEHLAVFPGHAVVRVGGKFLIVKIKKRMVLEKFKKVLKAADQVIESPGLLPCRPPDAHRVVHDNGCKNKGHRKKR